MQSLDMISMNKDPVPLMQKKQDPLVGGFNHLEICKFINGKDDIPYKTKFMFETTNQQYDPISKVSTRREGDFSKHLDH